MTKTIQILYSLFNENINPASPFLLIESIFGLHVILGFSLIMIPVPTLFHPSCRGTNVFFLVIPEDAKCSLTGMDCHHFHQFLLLPSYLHVIDFDQVPWLHETTQHTFMMWNKLWPGTLLIKVNLLGILNMQRLPIILVFCCEFQLQFLLNLTKI